MKKIVFCLLAAALTAACGGDSAIDDPESQKPQPPSGPPEQETTTYSVAGNVQKGPFVYGATVTIRALDDMLTPTGKRYQTKTTDGSGAFAMDDRIESRYVEIVATGRYFNEISGGESDASITLRALADLKTGGPTNVNLLTTLEADRMRRLVGSNGRTVQSARQQAEKEIFDVFHIPNAVSPTDGFNRMNMVQGGEPNAILLAVSATLQSGRSTAELSDLISRISSEIETDGAIRTETVREEIRKGGMAVNAETVRANLEALYTTLGVGACEIPPFEDYLDVDGNGSIDKSDSWLILSENEFRFSDGGGTFEVMLRHNVDYDVVIEDDAAGWIANTTSRAYLETDRLTFSVSENTTYDARYARIAVKDRSSARVEYIAVSQKQRDALTVTSDRFEIGKEGGTIEVEVKSNIGFEVEIPAECRSWISRAPSARGLTAESLLFAIAASEDPEVREGRIVFRSGALSETVTVYQTGEKVLVLNRKEYTVPDAGATIRVEVTGNVDYEIVMPAVDWISETQQTRGIVTDTRSFVIAPNPQYDPRDAVIIFRDKNSSLQERVTVYQTQKDAIVIARRSYDFDNRGGDLALTVQANVDVEVEIPEASRSWISRAPQTRGLTEQTLHFTVAANSGYDKRAGEIIVGNASKGLTETIRIYQAQKDAIILTQNEYALPEQGGRFSVEVRSNVDFTVAVSGGASWLHQSTTRSLVSHTLDFTVDANTTYDSRDAVITITDTKNILKESIRVHQSQKDAVIVGTDKFDVPYAGGTVTIGVKSNVDYEVAVIEGREWISRVPGTQALTESSVVLAVAANGDVVERVGKVTVTDLKKGICNTVTITQAANTAAVTVHVAQAGTLAALLSETQKAHLVNMKVTGSIDKADFKTIEQMPKLAELDLSEARIEGNIVPNEAMSSPGYYDSWKSNSNIETIVLPDDVISIGEHAFDNCKSLRRINIPKKTTQIKYGAFSHTALESIDIPANVLIIGPMAFASCAELQSVTFAPDAKLMRIESSASGDALGNTSSYGAFGRCSKLRRFELPASVSHLGVGTFNNCTALEELVIPDNTSLTTIEGYYYIDSYVIGAKPVTGGLIEGCFALKTLRIPAKITRLDKYAFADSGIETVIFAENTQCSHIGNQVFAACRNLREIVIPASVRTMGDQVFVNCTSLTALDLSKVTTLGQSLFSGCTSLKTVALPDNMTEIGEKFFAGCSALEACDISDKVTNIGTEAFSGCAKLLNIPVSAGLRSIGPSAFKGCTGLKTVVIPHSVESIESYAFGDCSGITDFTLQHNDSIALFDGIFNNCSSLKNLQLTARRIYLIGAIFEGTRITSFEMPAEVEFWGSPLVASYSNYGKYRWNNPRFERSLPFKDSMISSITFAPGSRLKECGTWAFAGAEYVTSLTLPASVEILGAALFEGDTSLLEFSIPPHIKQIKGPVYSYSSVLRPMLETPENIVSLGDCALFGIMNTSLDLSNCAYLGSGALGRCPELSSVALCKSGTLYLGRELFYESPKVTEIVFPQGLTELTGWYQNSEVSVLPFAYSSVKRIRCEPNCQIAIFNYVNFADADQLESVDLSNITADDVSMKFSKGGNHDYEGFGGCLQLSEWKLPRCKRLYLEGRSDESFKNTPLLTRLEIPGTIQKITTKWNPFINSSIVEITAEPDGAELELSSSVFSGMPALQRVYLPNLKIVGSSAFAECSALSDVVLGSGDIIMGKSVFNKCVSLKEFVIADHVTSITFQENGGMCATLSGSSIETIRSSSNARLKSLAASFKNSGKNTLLRTVDLPTVVSVPDKLFAGYTNLTNVLLPSVESVGKSAFEGCTNISAIDLPNVSTIGEGVFSDCTGLVEVSMPKITTIGKNLFVNCSNLSRIDLPNVTKIEGSVFVNCSALTQVNLPKVTEISGEAFFNCSALTKIDLPNVTKIGDRYSSFDGKSVFSGCSALAQINMPEVRNIGDYTFSGCSALTMVDMPKVTAIGKGAFSGCSALVQVDMPKVTEIEKETFFNCSSLSKVDLPNVRMIYDSAFGNCTSLSTVSFPQLQYLYTKGFYNTALSTVDFPASIYSLGDSCLPATVTSVICRKVEPIKMRADVYPFALMDLPNCTLRVPAGSVDAYKAHAQWGKFGTILPIE